MNAISVDRENWQRQGVPSNFGRPASQLADAYVKMGASPTFTCAPYLLDTKPKKDETIAWAESNAVVYANSVLGARTVKHPDFFDLFIALTGRAPLSGAYLNENRAARKIVNIAVPDDHDEALWPMLGYLAGQFAPDVIPLLKGLEKLNPNEDDLKALCAAFGTTSAAPMLHISGHTPEANLVVEGADSISTTSADLSRIWKQLNPGSNKIDLIALGSPHFSLNECRTFATIMQGHKVADKTDVIITLGRNVLSSARDEGIIDRLELSGVQIVPDICWCSISEPVFPPTAKTLMTNSGKYAHYAAGLTGRDVRFGSLANCAKAARTGFVTNKLPEWLS